jgi:sortase (surface protein transpeptidase)
MPAQAVAMRVVMLVTKIERMKEGMNKARSKIASLSALAVFTLSLSPAAYSAPSQVSTQAPSTAAPPASMPFADSAFENVWMRNDSPVASKAVARSWTWGPAPLATGLESYTDAPDGSSMRLVQYFDKSRMEINNPKLSAEDKWFVTNGLLTVELISGHMQVGNTKFEGRKPATVNMASDVDDLNAPTYASFAGVSNTSVGLHPQPDKTKDGYATGRINRAGAVTEDASKSKLAEAKIAYFEKVTGHNIPRVFWDFLNSSGIVRTGMTTSTKAFLDPWVFAMGLPISDAYWATVKIEGKMQEVLIQAFERRVLTYVATLPKGWQVQMGNIGQHYYDWRYGAGGAGPEKRPKVVPGMPMSLTIPSIGVHTKIEYVSVDKDGNMDIPKDPANVAWFRPGTIPGNPGNAVMDGHLDWYGVKQAVFYFLDKLKPGDRAYVRDDKGRDRAFVVTANTTCVYNKCPLTDIYGPTGVTRLNLITCAGVFNRASQNYDKRTVVYTEMAP